MAISTHEKMSGHEKAEEFEKKLKYIFRLGLVAALLHKATAWLGAGALTWATVVLMGGFASQVPISEFEWITGLVVLIASLLAVTRFSAKLVTKKTLFTGSIHPVHFTYTDKRRFVVTLIELTSLFFQLLLIIPCLWKGYTTICRPEYFEFMLSFFNRHTAVPSARSPAASLQASSPAASLQACLRTCFSASSYSSATTMADICAQSCAASASAGDITADNNLQVCLFSFFLLVIATASFAALCMVYRWMVKPRLWQLYVGDRNCLSLRRYHDEVLSRALNLGLAEADDFDARQFLLQALGEDLMMRNIGPLEVKRQNLEVIHYLYDHPNGSEMVYGGLASENTLLQQAAANIVGFWDAKMRLDGHLELLCRLGEKLGMPGKVAEGAANSFKALACAWSKTNKEPSPLLRVRVSRSAATGGGGYYTVVDRVVDLVTQKWAPTLLVYVRALDSFFMSPSIRDHVPQAQRAKLDEKLMNIIENPGGRTQPRTQLIAFSVLYRLRIPEETQIFTEEEKGSMKTQKEYMKALLEQLDSGPLRGQKSMWIQEVERYEELCKLLGKNRGAWLAKCRITGRDLVEKDSLPLSTR